MHLLVMAKAPVAGRVKTRLCPPCTPGEAAGLAEAALADTLDAVLEAGAGRCILALEGEPGPWLPAGFEVETLPVNQSLKFAYGSFDIKYIYDAPKNQVTTTAKFTLTNHVIPAAKYTELQQYLDLVAKAQNKKLVIKRKA